VRGAEASSVKGVILLSPDYSTALIDGLCQTKSRCPKSVELKDSNHFSEGMAIGTPDQQLTGPLLQWIEALTARGQPTP